MADLTTNLSLRKPIVNSEKDWGLRHNENWDILDPLVFEGVSSSISVEAPSGADNVSFLYTSAGRTISNIIPTISGLAADSGITWSLRFDADRSDHDGSTEVIISGTNTHLGNTGTAISTFDTALITAGTHLWLETTSISGSVESLSLTIESVS